MSQWLGAKFNKVYLKEGSHRVINYSMEKNDEV